MSFSEWIHNSDEPESNAIDSFKWGLVPSTLLGVGGYYLGSFLRPDAVWYAKLGMGALFAVLGTLAVASVVAITLFCIAAIGLGFNVLVRKINEPIYDRIRVIQDRKTKLQKAEAGALSTPQEDELTAALRKLKATPKPSKGESIKR